jgi:uncharacterized membrane protein
VILKQFDGRPQPIFAFKLTLNTLIQFIATAGTVSISSFIVSAVGQLAWLSYKGRQLPLADFELHRQATGVGSLTLLFHLGFSWRRLVQRI